MGCGCSGRARRSVGRPRTASSGGDRARTASAAPARTMWVVVCPGGTSVEPTASLLRAQREANRCGGRVKPAASA